MSNLQANLLSIAVLIAMAFEHMMNILVGHWRQFVMSLYLLNINTDVYLAEDLDDGSDITPETQLFYSCHKQKTCRDLYALLHTRYVLLYFVHKGEKKRAALDLLEEEHIESRVKIPFGVIEPANIC